MNNKFVKRDDVLPMTRVVGISFLRYGITLESRLHRFTDPDYLNGPGKNRSVRVNFLDNEYLCRYDWNEKQHRIFFSSELKNRLNHILPIPSGQYTLFLCEDINEFCLELEYSALCYDLVTSSASCSKTSTSTNLTKDDCNSNANQPATHKNIDTFHHDKENNESHHDKSVCNKNGLILIQNELKTILNETTEFQSQIKKRIETLLHRLNIAPDLTTPQPTAIPSQHLSDNFNDNDSANMAGRKMGKFLRNAFVNYFRSQGCRMDLEGNWAVRGTLRRLLRYSRNNHGRYWYGIEEKDYINWSTDCSLVFLTPPPEIDNTKPESCQYVELSPEISRILIDTANRDSRGQIKVNIYITGTYVEIKELPNMTVELSSFPVSR